MKKRYLSITPIEDDSITKYQSGNDKTFLDNKNTISIITFNICKFIYVISI